MMIRDLFYALLTQSKMFSITIGGITYTTGTITITTGTTFTVIGSGEVSTNLVGGGGGGGTGNSNYGTPGQGGKAGILTQENLALTDGTYTVQIGAKGAGATATFYGANGNAGGITSISKGGTTLISASGGAGGAGGGVMFVGTTTGESSPYGGFGAGGDGGAYGVSGLAGTDGGIVITF